MTTAVVTETVGQRLHRLRLERGLSQRELAEPGISYAYISRIEADVRNPSVKALRRIAPKLGVTVEYLETGQDFLSVAVPADAVALTFLHATGDQFGIDQLTDEERRMLDVSLEHALILAVRGTGFALRALRDMRDA